VAVGNDEQWRRLCDRLEWSRTRDRSAWAKNPDRVRHRAELVSELAALFAGDTREKWLALLREAHVPAGPVREVQDVVRDPALAARGMIGEATLADAQGPVRLFSLPWRIDRMRPAIRLPPPRLGQHTEEFLARYG